MDWGATRRPLAELVSQLAGATASMITTPEMSLAPDRVRSIVSVSETVYVVSVSAAGVVGTKFVPSNVRT